MDRICCIFISYDRFTENGIIFAVLVNKTSGKTDLVKSIIKAGSKMDLKLLQEKQAYILSLLKQKRLKEAISELESIFWSESKTDLANIKMTYEYMLKYMLDGVVDTQRYSLHQKLIRETLEISDLHFLKALDQHSNNLFHQRRRTELPKLENMTYTSLLHILEGFNDELAVNDLVNDKRSLEFILARHEKALSDLFAKAWLANPWTNSEKDEVDLYLSSKNLNESDLSLLISAITQALLTVFDTRKFTWLIEAYKKQLVFASPRALVGIVLVLHYQKERLSYYPDLNAQLSFLVDDPKTSELINQIYVQLLQSQETEKIDRKMREEIIPEMMKNASAMQDMKFGFEEGEDEGEHNPDWQDAMEKSGMGDKIREMSELQMQGADIYMSSFATLKGYPFFYSIQNWFYPFDTNHSAVYHEFGGKDHKGSIVDLILNSGLFCNSDKYSLCFTFQHIPQNQRDAMIGQLTEQQMGGLEDEQKLTQLQELTEKPSIITNQYIHDLYRFNKLFRFKNDFKDIFNSKIELHTIPQLEFIKTNSEYLNTLAEFFLRNEHFERAIEMYDLLRQSKESSFELFQKKGYCYQKLKEFDLAIESYIKADMLKPDNVWTNRHLAYCYRAINKHEKAIQYYQAVEKVQPENMSVLFYIGMCYTALEMYDEALQYFFKMDFMQGKSKKAWRAIGWCSFISGKLDQAKNYYAKVLANKPVPIDYLNAGHVDWALGNLKEALALYNKAAKSYESKDEFIEVMRKDTPYLIKQGIPREDIPLLIDLLDGENSASGFTYF